jgi:hypothetical protein
MSTTVEQSPLPSRHAVRSLIGDLIGRDIDLQDGSPVPAKTTNVVAVFVTDKLATSAVAVVSLEGAARLGGAFGMVPRAGVDDAIAERSLSPLLRDNCYEVLNVMSAAFNVPGAPHVRLYEMYGPDAIVPGDVAALVGLAGSRMDITLRVAGYGDVALSIVVR